MFTQQRWMTDLSGEVKNAATGLCFSCSALDKVNYKQFIVTRAIRQWNLILSPSSPPFMSHPSPALPISLSQHLLRPDQYQPPRKMLEFSRKYQEERVVASIENDIRQLTATEVDLEVSSIALCLS